MGILTSAVGLQSLGRCMHMIEKGKESKLTR